MRLHIFSGQHLDFRWRGVSKNTHLGFRVHSLQGMLGFGAFDH